MASAGTYIFILLICLAVLALLVCLACCCICSRYSRLRRRQSPALPSDFRPEQTGHLYSHVIFADRTYQARMGERRSRFADQLARTELAAPHASQLHPNYLPPSYSEVVVGGGGHLQHDDNELPPNYAAAVAAAAAASDV